MCTVYQKKTVINIAVTPLLSLNAWMPKNDQAKAVIVYTTCLIIYSPKLKIVVLYYLPTSYPTNLQGFLKLLNMMNYLIKSIFKDKPSIVLIKVSI